MKTRSLIENYQSFHLSSKKTFSTISSNSIIEKRGRQLLTFRNNLSKTKEYNVNITNSKNSTCESNHNHSNHNNIKIHRKIFKRNKINSNSKSDNSKLSDSDSFSSNDIRKKVFYEEESFNYPTKSDVGLISSEEDSIEIDPHLKFNFENEIESILIEIYNKNFPSNDKVSKRKNHLLKRDKYRYLKKNNIEVNKNELKITFGQLNERYNFFVLQILSKKIKELIYKYKEKLFENEDLSKINQEFKKKKEEINNTTNKFFQEIFNQTDRKNLKDNNNRMFSPTASTSSNISDSYMLNQFNLDKTYFNSIFLQIIKSINSNLGNTIFKELDNIKTSLRNSSIEIKQIFQYPLNLLKNNFSIECIQLEAFNTILIRDDLISTILIQTKQYLNKKNLNSYLELINSLVNDKKYDREEMTRFDKLLSQILKNKVKNVNNDNSINENCKECFIDNNSIESDNDNINENIYIKKNIFSSSFCSIDSHVNVNNNNNNNSSNNNKVNTETVNNEEENRLLDLDIDDLVKLIDSDENNNHKKKKKKKNKKNKNKKICNKTLNNNNEKIIIENKNIVNDCFEEMQNKDFENIYNEFKVSINKDSLNNVQKIKPKLSANWLMKLYTSGV